MLYAYANTPFSYTYNINLDNTLDWTAQTVVTTLSCNLIFDQTNTNMSVVNSVIDITNLNLPNPNNYSLTISANAQQTLTYFANATNSYDRVLRVSTVYISNTNQKIHANDMYLTVRNSVI